jgi:hypothetical protein
MQIYVDDREVSTEAEIYAMKLERKWFQPRGDIERYGWSRRQGVHVLP